MSRSSLTALPPHVSRKEIKFDGVNFGQVGTIKIFAATDLAWILAIGGHVKTGLVGGAGATIALGTALNPTAFIAPTLVSALGTVGLVWTSTTPAVGVAQPAVNFQINDPGGIVLTIAVAAITAGVLGIECGWKPMVNQAVVG